MSSHIAPCGIDCVSCDAYIATVNDDKALRQKLADQFKEHYGDEVDPEKIRCEGCMNDGAHIGFCFECGIRKCAVEKGFRTCAECGELPCEKGSFIWKEHSKSLERLNAIKEGRI